MNEEEDIDWDDFCDYFAENQDLLEKGYEIATYNYECLIYNEPERRMRWPQ